MHTVNDINDMIYIQIPDIAVYCFIGGSISEIVDIAQTGVGDNIAFIVVLCTTLIISIIGMIIMSYYAKKRFDKMVKKVKSMRVESDSFDLYDDDDMCSEMRVLNDNKSSKGEYNAVV